MKSISDLIRFLIEKRKLKIITISLIGSMGEGKTNFMRYLSCALNELGFRQFYRLGVNVDEIPAILESISGAGDRIALYLDDISFTISGTSSEVKKSENALSRIRHILDNTEGTTVLCMGYHYSKAANPFIRQISKIVILFDIAKHTIDVYEEFFSRRYLREFESYYDAWIWMKPKLVKKMIKAGMDPYKWRPVLARVINREGITWIPLTETHYWEEIPSNDKVESTEVRVDSKDVNYLLERLRRLREKGVIKLTGRYIYIRTNGKEVPFMKRNVAEKLGIVEPKQ